MLIFVKTKEGEIVNSFELSQIDKIKIIAFIKKYTDTPEEANDFINMILKTHINLEYYKHRMNFFVNNKKNIIIPVTLFNIENIDENIDENIEMNKKKIKNVSEEIDKKMEKSSYLYHVLQGHANCVFINPTSQIFEHYEPGIDTEYDYNAVHESIKNLHKTIKGMENYKYINQLSTSPYNSVQIDDDECVVYSVYYAINRILYPDKPSEEIQLMMIAKHRNTTHENFRKNYKLLDQHEVNVRVHNLKLMVQKFVNTHNYLNMLLESHIDNKHGHNAEITKK
jgi:hypothetical protein